MTGWITNNGSTHAIAQLQSDPAPERHGAGFEQGGRTETARVCRIARHRRGTHFIVWPRLGAFVISGFIRYGVMRHGKAVERRTGRRSRAFLSFLAPGRPGILSLAFKRNST
ncbi:MAG: hypothetical protein QOJ04_2438 [Caballeronia sp.]|jgi:hypothetical protein|nr:hypothetical protein [Caballeronia sp.]MEA3113759.1 hypothetical protein [Caballeronia sp.]